MLVFRTNKPGIFASLEEEYYLILCVCGVVPLLYYSGESFPVFHVPDTQIFWEASS